MTKTVESKEFSYFFSCISNKKIYVFNNFVEFSNNLTVGNLVLQNKPPDWQDFVGIITLLIINSTISFIEENNASNAAAALMARLAPKAKV